MFGLLLGGLIARAVAPKIASAGVLGGLLNRGRGMGGVQQQPSSPASSKDAPMAPSPQAPAGQAKAEEQVAQPQQQPYKPPPATQAPEQIASPTAQAKAEQANPLKGLIDEAPAAPKPQAKPGEPVAPPQDVVNKTDVMTPVARPTESVAGQTPVLKATEILPNRLMDSGTNRQIAEYQDANPSRAPDLPNQSFTADQGYRYQGQTVVGGAMPARRYRSV